MSLIALAAVADCAWVAPSVPDGVGRLVVANGLLAATALAFSWVLGRDRHFSIEMAIFAELLIVDLTVAAVIGLDARVSLLCAGYLLLLPPIVALLVPWSLRLHLGWLATHAVASLLMLPLVPGETVALGGRRAVLTLLAVASAASVLGHLLNLRARVTSFALIQEIRAMHRAARRSEDALRDLNARLEHVAWTDGLTGFGNRHALQVQLAAVRGRIARRGDRYALLMLDLDHFKAINDTYGHFAGDDVLRQVAAAISDAVRSGDVAFRFGGEEFVAVMGIARADDARAGAERIRAAVQGLAIAHPANAPFGVVTVSIGVSLVDGAALGDPDDSWLRQSDLALYEAKRQGRNRVVLREAPVDAA
ncbi:MAG TPA: diguanylate cyclase [Candidatus Limnocylindrales bacterium]|nr:diguanylate cyclase [Candidatus Limnocylindrales bacterium]